MRGGRAAGVAALLVATLSIGAFFHFHRNHASSVPAPRPLSQRPPLMLLTTLPIMFPEGFTLKAPPSAALEALQSHYRVVPISVADAAELDHRRLLLMAQPQAQPAEALVDLDNWVRGGGRVLLLADPALEWPSDRPLGSLLRPPFALADTGLLAHWGLRLQAPDRLGKAEVELDGLELSTRSPGSVAVTGHECSVESGGFIARCRIGSGEATVIADADFLNVPFGQGESANLDALLIELERLEH
jgi:hypothetical protein